MAAWLGYRRLPRDDHRTASLASGGGGVEGVVVEEGVIF